jgi:hypothetical protein
MKWWRWLKVYSSISNDCCENTVPTSSFAMVLCFAGWLSGCKLPQNRKCIVCGENTLHWTTECCFVQGDWQCTLTTNLQSQQYSALQVGLHAEIHVPSWSCSYVNFVCHNSHLCMLTQLVVYILQLQLGTWITANQPVKHCTYCKPTPPSTLTATVITKPTLQDWVTMGEFKARRGAG